MPYKCLGLHYFVKREGIISTRLPTRLLKQGQRNSPISIQEFLVAAILRSIQLSLNQFIESFYPFPFILRIKGRVVLILFIIVYTTVNNTLTSSSVVVLAPIGPMGVFFLRVPPVVGVVVDVLPTAFFLPAIVPVFYTLNSEVLLLFHQLIPLWRAQLISFIVISPIFNSSSSIESIRIGDGIS